MRKSILFLACLTAGVAAAGPAHIVITVPQGKPAGVLPGLLAEWRQTGAIADAFLLNNASAKDAAFTSVAVLQFPDQASAEGWRRNGATQLEKGTMVTAVETVARGETFPRDSANAIFEVAQYNVAASPDAYAKFVKICLIPEMEAVRGRKILTSYFLFAARDRSGAPWQSLLLLEYRDSVAFDRRQTALDAVRTELATNGAWSAAAASRDSTQKQRSLSRAAWELLPAPELSDLPSYKPEYHVTGTIRVLGSFLKFATSNLLEGFLKYQPDAQVATNFSTSSEGAIGGLCTGISDVAPAGDDGKITDMMPFYNTHGYLPLEISVATGDYEKRGALWPGVILVNKENPISHLSMDQLDRIFGSERIGGWDIDGTAAHNILYTSKYARGKETNIRTWGQLGLNGEWAGKEIQTYGYAAPGFEIYFERKLFHWVDKWNPNFREYVEAKQAIPGPDGAPVSSDTLLEELSRDKYGIGWCAMFHAENYPDLKALAIAPGATKEYVEYTPATVANRSYPLVRDAYFYVDREPGRPLDPKVREFMRFVLSREGQQIIAHTGFFYPLPAPYLKQQLRKLD